MWTWIGRDVLPDDFEAVDDIVNNALVNGDEAKAKHFVRALQDRVAMALTDQLRQADTDAKVRRRMLAQIGTQRAGEDVAILKSVLNARDGLSAMASSLPLQVGNPASQQLD